MTTEQRPPRLYDGTRSLIFDDVLAAARYCVKRYGVVTSDYLHEMVCLADEHHRISGAVFSKMVSWGEIKHSGYRHSLRPERKRGLIKRYVIRCAKTSQQ
jgi:hypothetical protein